MADDEYSVPGDVVEGVGGRTYSGGTFSGILSHPWSKRRPSTYSSASRNSQVHVAMVAFNHKKHRDQREGHVTRGQNRY